MPKTFFIIPGFTHHATEPQYKWLREHVKSLGYTVRIVPISWKRRVMSDYTQEFLEFFRAHKTEENHVLGFSFGAMIAFITAAETQPTQLYLCSLSPYFKEDINNLPPKWLQVIGSKRAQDFKTFSAHSIARQVPSKTIVFCGDDEGHNFPTLLQRCRQATRDVQRSQLVLPKDAPHKLDHPGYIEALNKYIV